MHGLIDALLTFRCGPLIRSWCMRYEAKNKYFKKIAGVLGNFKNIQKSVAFRHQRNMCHKMTCTHNFLEGTAAQYGNGKYSVKTRAHQPAGGGERACKPHTA